MKSELKCLAAIAITIGACHRDSPEETPATEATTSTPAPSASAPPVDHLASDELLEGPEQAFGLALPRGVAVLGRFWDVVYVQGQAPLASLVKYFRSRVRDGSMTVGEKSATFDKVHLPAKPGLELRIEITPGPATMNIEVRDVSPRPVVGGPSDDESRWRALGLTKDGKLADPTHLQ
jgi:hypothetical protein